MFGRKYLKTNSLAMRRILQIDQRKPICVLGYLSFLVILFLIDHEPQSVLRIGGGIITKYKNNLI